jgi:hypothetical protein
MRPLDNTSLGQRVPWTISLLYQYFPTQTKMNCHYMLALYEYARLHLSANLPNLPYYKDSLFQCYRTHESWMHSLRDALSKGRTIEASSMGCLVQERPCPGDASSKGRIIRDSVFGDTTFLGKKTLQQKHTLLF